jgi:hypothetical protein
MTQHTTPARLSAEDRALLEEIATFNGESISDAIRRSIRTEHALLNLAKIRDRRREIAFLNAYGEQFAETYQARVAELAERRRLLLGEDSPLLVR